MEPHELRLFEFVVASPHSLLRQVGRSDGADGGCRVAAWRVPSSAIPRGANSTCGRRAAADWDRVFAVAARRAGGDRDRRLVGSAGRALRAGRARARARLPVCARQRRARASGARLRRHRHRARQAGGHSPRIGSSTTGRTSGSSGGRVARGTADHRAPGHWRYVRTPPSGSGPSSAFSGFAASLLMSF